MDGSWSEEANKRFSELVSSRLKIHFIDNFRGKLYLRLVYKYLQIKAMYYLLNP